MRAHEVLQMVGCARAQGGEQFKAANDCAPGKMLVDVLPRANRDDDALVEIIDQLIGGQDPLSALVVANDNSGLVSVEAIDPMNGIVDERS